MASLQIGDPSVIAERTGLTTVADFRARDLAAGGEGAPLAPFFHYAAFATPDESRVVLNLGGIANVTWIPRGAGPDEVIAFDVGPANALIDGVVALATEGRERMDLDGGPGDPRSNRCGASRRAPRRRLPAGCPAQVDGSGTLWHRRSRGAFRALGRATRRRSDRDPHGIHDRGRGPRLPDSSPGRRAGRPHPGRGRRCPQPEADEWAENGGSRGRGVVVRHRRRAGGRRRGDGFLADGTQCVARPAEPSAALHRCAHGADSRERSCRAVAFGGTDPAPVSVRADQSERIRAGSRGRRPRPRSRSCRVGPPSPGRGG